MKEVTEKASQLPLEGLVAWDHMQETVTDQLQMRLQK